MQTTHVILNNPQHRGLERIIITPRENYFDNQHGTTWNCYFFKNDYVYVLRAINCYPVLNIVS